jgi:hypothetical protein
VVVTQDQDQDQKARVQRMSQQYQQRREECLKAFMAAYPQFTREEALAELEAAGF